MGVLTLIKSGSGVFGNFKTYNVKLFSDAVLGIIINDTTIKEKVLINESNNFKLNDGIDINGKISCVLVEKQQEKHVPIIWFCGTKDVNKFTMMNIIYKEELTKKGSNDIQSEVNINSDNSVNKDENILNNNSNLILNNEQNNDNLTNY